MKNKYNMTVEQNVFVAKRNIVDYIWKSAKLEGIAVTYPDTEAIYNGLVISGMKVDDILTINNLKRAWHFILSNMTYPTDYSIICQINRIVGGGGLIYNAGQLRSVPVSIGGTNWKPEIPIEAMVKEELEDIYKIGCATDRAITLLLYLVRKQIFLDGNKRTAVLAGNHLMISKGAGIISVPIDQQATFLDLLLSYYESNEMKEIKGFIYNVCIDGLDFNTIS